MSSRDAAVRLRVMEVLVGARKARPRLEDMVRGKLCLFILIVSTCGLLFAAEGAYIGPGGGGAFFEPTVSPHDPNQILVACDMTNGYFSDSGGRSWRSFNLRGRIRFFAFDPKDPKVLYAKSVGLWRSVDAGVTWSLVYPDPKEVRGIEMQGDHAGEDLITDPSRPQIQALAIDHGNSKTMYAALGHKRAAWFATSTDAGETWKGDTPLPAGTHRLVVDPAPGVATPDIYALGTSSMAARRHGKWVEVRAPAGAEGLSDLSAGFSGAQGAKLYLLAGGAVYVSGDAGATWKKSPLPGEPEVRAIAASPDHPEIAYASYKNLEEGSGDKSLTYLGVARTDDGGATWKLVRKEKEGEHKPLGDDWIGEFFGSGYAAAPIALVVAPNRPMTVYSTDAGRVLRSDDGGVNWKAIYSSRLNDGSFAGTGMEGTNAHGVHFDPFDSKRIFVSYTDIGLFRSENGGVGWLPSTEGVPHNWRNTTYWMVFDPAVRGRAWAVMSKIHDLPRTKIFDRRPPSSFIGGVTISDDGGRTWSKSSNGMPLTAPTYILLDPTSPPNARVLYVAACGSGVYKSVDGGKNWILKNGGIAEKEPRVWRIIRDTSGGLYLVIVRGREEAAPGSGDDGALYYSGDGAEHWRRVALPEAVNGPTGLAVDPKNADRVYLSAWGRFTEGGQEGGGIYLSTDRGTSWRHVLAADGHVFDVTVDEHSPNVIYAAGFESSAWRSKDSGVSWQRIAGFNFKWGQSVIPDPADASKIYITTFGGGFWHGPAEGEKSKADEIITPVVGHGAGRGAAPPAHLP